MKVRILVPKFLARHNPKAPTLADAQVQIGGDETMDGFLCVYETDIPWPGDAVRERNQRFQEERRARPPEEVEPGPGEPEAQPA